MPYKPIIICTRRGYRSTTKYDVKDSADRNRLKNNIRAIARKRDDSNCQAVEAYSEARLKFIAINILLAKKALKNTNYDLNDVQRYLNGKLSKPLTAEEQAIEDPEQLFEAPKSRSAKHPVRKCSPYEANETASLQAELAEKPKKTDLSDADYILRSVERHEEQIKEHAIRRVELLFLLFVAYYGKNRVVSIADTEKQFGKGALGYGHAACHSSFFTALTDKADSNKRVTRAAAKKMQDKSILEGTHVADAINSTVELPEVVNIVDRLLEGRNGMGASGMRGKLRPYLSKVSRKELTPLEAMTKFFELMHGYFASRKLKTGITRSSEHAPATARQKVKELEEQGTDYWTKKESVNKPSVGAISCWFGVAEDVAKKIESDNETAESHYQRLQNEIFKVPAA
jgi:hypothetical protein